MCDRNEVSQSCARALHAAPHILRNNWLRKDKVVGRGASRGNALEQGLSTLSVTLPSEQIGCVLVSEGTKEKKHKRKRKERKQSRCGSCRGPRLLNNQAYAKNHCFGSSVVMCFDFLLFFFTLSVLSRSCFVQYCWNFFFPSFPVELGSKYWLKVEWKAFRSLFSGRGCPVSGHRGY